MKADEAFAFFGSKRKTAKALGITKGAVSQWGEYVPARRVEKIHMLMRASGQLPDYPPMAIQANEPPERYPMEKNHV